MVCWVFRSYAGAFTSSHLSQTFSFMGSLGWGAVYIHNRYGSKKRGLNWKCFIGCHRLVLEKNVYELIGWWIFGVEIYLPTNDHQFLNFIVRLKNINPMSQSCRAHLFFGAHLIQQNSRFDFFCLLNFFFPFFFLWTCLSKYTRKDMADTMKHFEQQTFSTLCSVLYLVHPEIKFHISKLWPTQIWHVCCSGKKMKKKKNVKKTAFWSGLPICHELWDIAFIFLSLILY